MSETEKDIKLRGGNLEKNTTHTQRGGDVKCMLLSYFPHKTIESRTKIELSSQAPSGLVIFSMC